MKQGKNMIRFIVFAILILNVLLVNAQIKTSVYSPSNEDFPNPERGFYLAMGAKVGELSADELIKMRTIYSVKSAEASYSTWITLIYKGYLLTEFREDLISTEYLQKLNQDFESVRKAGLKVILRFSYTDKSRPGDCPDKDICPPYGDASKAIVLQHIKQLKPLFEKNADVISVFQQGFIGIWGENHYTDYFGDASRNDLGFVPDSSWVDRNDMLKALLDAVPKERMVQVRTPQLKQRFLFGSLASVNTKPSSGTGAFNFSDNSRIALHNDCFLASADDYGTFSDYGNSSKVKVEANGILRTYFEAESKYVAVGGETCDDNFSPQNDCSPIGHAMQEMAAMHYSFLNVSYNNLVNNDWETQGCMSDIKRKLGYRFVLKESVVTQKLKPGGKLNLQLKLQNEGFATPYNPRPVQLILRNTKTKSIYRLTLKTNIQKWYSGEVSINELLTMPKEIKAGAYELLLNMPDGYQSLQKRPEYSIRLANNNIWENATGFNKLNQTILIRK